MRQQLSLWSWSELMQLWFAIYICQYGISWYMYIKKCTIFSFVCNYGTRGLHHYAFSVAVRNVLARGTLHWTSFEFFRIEYRLIRIRTPSIFSHHMQSLYGKRQNPDCVVLYRTHKPLSSHLLRVACQNFLQNCTLKNDYPFCYHYQNKFNKFKE